MKQVESNPDNLDKKAWSDFVYNHPQGNIFHIPEMFDVYALTKRITPVLVCCLIDNEIVGILVGAIHTQYSGFAGYFTSRCIIIGGPLVKNNDPVILDDLLKAYNKKIKNRALFTQFRNLSETIKYQSAFPENGYLYEPHLDIQINLKQDTDAYWNSLKSKLRQNIRKAINSDVKFKLITSISDISSGYQILEEVYKNAKLPLPDISLFLNTFKILFDKNKVAFFAAIRNEEIIGIRFVLLYKDVIYDWYAGSKKEFYAFCPNDFLPYKVIEWGLGHPVYNHFIFGGAGKPGIPYGVRDHKLKFCNNLIEPGRFERIHNPLLYKAAKGGFKLWRKLK